MSSVLLTEEVIRQAISLVGAAFMAAVGSGKAKRPAIHIVVMDPTKSPEGHSFEEAILCEVSIGDAGEYVSVARSKADISWRYRLPSQEVQQFYPHLLVEGMTKWGGSTYLHRIPVGASGVEYQMDQWVSEMVAVTCRALCIGPMRAIVEGPDTFLGGGSS